MSYWSMLWYGSHLHVSTIILFVWIIVLSVKIRKKITNEVKE